MAFMLFKEIALRLQIVSLINCIQMFVDFGDLDFWCSNCGMKVVAVDTYNKSISYLNWNDYDKDPRSKKTTVFLCCKKCNFSLRGMITLIDSHKF
jgi:hypothetical protein